MLSLLKDIFIVTVSRPLNETPHSEFLEDLPRPFPFGGTCRQDINAFLMKNSISCATETHPILASKWCHWKIQCNPAISPVIMGRKQVSHQASFNYHIQASKAIAPSCTRAIKRILNQRPTGLIIQPFVMRRSHPAGISHLLYCPRVFSNAGTSDTDVIDADGNRYL